MNTYISPLLISLHKTFLLKEISTSSALIYRDLVKMQILKKFSLAQGLLRFYSSNKRPGVTGDLDITNLRDALGVARDQKMRGNK